MSSTIESKFKRYSYIQMIYDMEAIDLSKTNDQAAVKTQTFG